MPADIAEQVQQSQLVFDYQYVKTLPFLSQVIIEAFLRDDVKATLQDGTILKFEQDGYRQFYREPNYEKFAAFLMSDTLAQCVSIVGASRGGRKITIRRETDGNWSVWLTRRYATYEISNLYQIPWISAEQFACREWNPSDEDRAIKDKTEAAYQALVPVPPVVPVVPTLERTTPSTRPLRMGDRPPRSERMAQ